MRKEQDTMKGTNKYLHLISKINKAGSQDKFDRLISQTKTFINSKLEATEKAKLDIISEIKLLYHNKIETIQKRKCIQDEFRAGKIPHSDQYQNTVSRFTECINTLDIKQGIAGSQKCQLLTEICEWTQTRKQFRIKYGRLKCTPPLTKSNIDDKDKGKAISLQMKTMGELPFFETPKEHAEEVGTEQTPVSKPEPNVSQTESSTPTNDNNNDNNTNTNTDNHFIDELPFFNTNTYGVNEEGNSESEKVQTRNQDENLNIETGDMLSPETTEIENKTCTY